MGSSPTKLNVIENGRIIIDIGTRSVCRLRRPDDEINTAIPAGSLLPITWRTTKTFLQAWQLGP